MQAKFRNYYPRKRVKKELGFNSGNYVGMNVGYVFDEIASNGPVEVLNTVFFTPVWGIQRNYKSNIHLGV